MFWKSQAGQDQSKVANQWALFGFKRSRALEMEAAAARARADSGYLRFVFPGSAADAEVVKWLNGDGPPRTELPPPTDERLVQLEKDIKDRKPEADLMAAAGQIKIKTINDAIDHAEDFNARTEKAWDEVTKPARALAKKAVDEAARDSVDAPLDPAKKARADAAQSLMFAMEERRYRGEGGLNNAIGFLYECRVKFSSAESDRHRKRSESFFYAMLAAQVGATISSLALARKRKSALWALAGASGIVAVVIGAYVYLTI
jgi:hypothetical protein